MMSLPESKETSLEAATLKKGLLWQQWDRFFSRWKERFFILTRDYLACFKKGSKIGISEMGSFLYKVNLVDVEGLQWVDKKRDGVIALKVGQEGQLLLWRTKGLDDWMFALREAVNRSKGRRETLRKANTLVPQLLDGGLWRRHGLFLQHTLSDSHMQASLVHRDTCVELHGDYDDIRPLADRHPTPHMARRIHRMSVLTDIDLSGETDSYEPSRSVFGPRLAPQCSSGSYSSLVSLGKYSANSHLQKPSPHSLQVSPALTQRSLYAQHVLSSPEIAPLLESRNSKSAMTTATSEFCFVHPDSPITASSCSTTHLSMPHCKQDYQRSQSCIAKPSSHPSLHDISSQKTETRPSSIYGQPSLTIDKIELYHKPPDVVPIAEERQNAKRSSGRYIRPYLHSKSDSLFTSGKLSASAEIVPKDSLALR